MGLFSSLLRKKNNSDVVNQGNGPIKSAASQEISKSAAFHLKGIPDERGLYPSELVMLAVAARYKTDETVFPQYLTYTYEIANPLKTLKDLQARGYLSVSNAIASMKTLKVDELKEIAETLGVSVKGRKAAIISQLAEVGEDKLSELIRVRNWELTSLGQSALDANPYISFFLCSHTYNLSEIGIDVWSINKEFTCNPERPFRDVIFRQINDKMNKASLEFQRNPNGGTASVHTYCECYRIMALFVEEEKSFVNASDYYFQYLYKRMVDCKMKLDT